MTVTAFDALLRLLGTAEVEFIVGGVAAIGEIAGGGTYDHLVDEAETATIEGRPLRYVTLHRLISLKRAAGRPKDLDMLAGLEALLEERGRP